MKEDHMIYLIVDALNLGTYEKYLGSFTIFMVYINSRGLDCYE